MAEVKVTLTCADYARVMPLAAGDVRPEGVDLTFIRGPRPEMLRRAMQDPAVDGGEGSMAQHLYRVDKGDRSFVALPVFVLRNFTARDLYVRQGGRLQRPEDLPGKRIGMYSWTASGSVWYRHFLRYLGVPLDTLEWTIGNPDEPSPGTPDPSFPANVKPAPAGRALSELLLAGELDAIYSPPRPKDYHPAAGPLARLFPDIRAVEREYCRQTRCYPPQHVIILRREAWERNPWIARSLQAAFEQTNDYFTQGQRLFPYASPWLEAELEETVALMGEDFHPYGVEPNRHAMETFCGMAHDLGLTSRRISVEEYFAEFLES